MYSTFNIARLIDCVYGVERLNGREKRSTVLKTVICVQASQPIRSVTSGNPVDFPELKFTVCNIDKYI